MSGKPRWVKILFSKQKELKKPAPKIMEDPLSQKVAYYLLPQQKTRNSEPSTKELEGSCGKRLCLQLGLQRRPLMKLAVDNLLWLRVVAVSLEQSPVMHTLHLHCL